ncbi:MMS19 nucleotide excision repair protein homolog [Tribolium madens]|uniref:MMS19 nucleotide excision repair protein homolog n=1 Tax=Tribolium madens TaxID=41895 RepID=UPI001CF7467E|nr:MMS19 nucleotide excision repair protein homolog [Tribolium madens]
MEKNLVENFQNLTQDDPKFGEKCQILVEGLESGQMTLLQLVEELRGLLVDTNPKGRELGMWVLTRVVETLPPDFFDETQLKFICQFYTDRLKDNHLVIPPVLRGFLVLIRHEGAPKGSAGAFLTQLFHNISCQQQQETDRFTIYEIFETCLDKFWPELSEMGPDFVYGVISAVDGERSPKNLIFLFDWFPKFLRKVELGHLTEDAFEILACYFPVDFRAPPQDENKITREILAEKLGFCLVAVPQFTEFSLQLALEKFDSSLEIAKLDSLRLIELLFNTFDVSPLMVWPLIQKELFQMTNPVIENACLITMTAVIKNTRDLILTETIKDICDTIKGNFLPDSKLFQASARLLISVANASDSVANLVVRETVPILTNMFNIANTASQKTPILQLLTDLYKVSTDLEFLGEIPVLLVKSTTDHDLNQVAFNCLAEVSPKIPEKIRHLLYQNYVKLLQVPQEGAILKCLECLARDYPNEIAINLVGNTENCTECYLDAICVTLVNQKFFTANLIDLILKKRSVNLLKKILIKFDNCEEIFDVLIARNVTNMLIELALTSDICHKTIAFILKVVIGRMSSEKQNEIIRNELIRIKIEDIFLLDGVLCCLRRYVLMNYEILNNLFEFIIRENDNLRRETAIQLVANILNKCSKDQVIWEFLDRFRDTKTDPVLVSWITKALIMRNHKLGTTWTNKLINHFEEDGSIAPCFRTIMSNCDSLSTKSRCNVAFLYQQKFFMVVTNYLSENYNPGKNSYLSGLGYLLEFAPKQAILVQFKKISKLILSCLDQCTNHEILIVILQLIRDFISTKESVIEENLGIFLTRFLKLTTYDNSMKVRILALQCLQEVTSQFPFSKLLPHKNDVLKVLGKVLDDKKRIVRKEAVEARSMWFLLDFDK